MVSLEEYKGQTPSWCPGCGNFSILKTFKEALAELGIEPNQFTIASGIGQAGKFPHYMKCNTFNGLHGRTLPVATALKLVNSGQIVIAVAGDGDHDLPAVDKFERGCDRERPPMESVEGIAFHVMGKFPGLSDPRSDGELVRLDAKLRKRLFECFEDAEVSTSRAP